MTSLLEWGRKGVVEAIKYAVPGGVFLAPIVDDLTAPAPAAKAQLRREPCANGGFQEITSTGFVVTPCPKTPPPPPKPKPTQQIPPTNSTSFSVTCSTGFADVGVNGSMGNQSIGGQEVDFLSGRGRLVKNVAIPGGTVTLTRGALTGWSYNAGFNPDGSPYYEQGYQWLVNGVPIPTAFIDGESVPAGFFYTPYISRVTCTEEPDDYSGPPEPSPPNIPPDPCCVDGADGADGEKGEKGDDAEVEYSDIDIPLVTCSNRTATTTQRSIQVIKGTEDQVLSHFEELAKVQKSQCECDCEPLLTLPDWYGDRPGANRPAIVLAFKSRNGTKWSRSSYGTTIHHPNAAALRLLVDATPPTRTRGNWFAHLKLVDGSQLKALGASKENAFEYLYWLVSQVETRYLPKYWQNQIVSGESRRTPPEIEKLYPRKVDYFARGAAANVNPTDSRWFD